jgi:5-methylcytosine-specific restriction enzyme subunit McrC
VCFFMLGIVMDELKKFFIDHGFDEKKVNQEEFNVTDQDYIISLFENNDALKVFLEFSRNLGLTPYSKQKPSLLFSIRENGKSVNGTTIGGFGEQKFELSGSKLPLLEIFIARFLHTIQTVVKRGLRSDYFPQQENLLTKRGKLNIGQQVKRNFIYKQRFYCEFDEYRHDRPANRLLKSALLSVSRYSRDANNQKWLRELLFYFDDVPASSAVKQDFSQLHLDRSMAHYKPALAWARLILNDLSPASMKGKVDATSLLFPMESAFESYVAQTLRKRLKEDYHLRTQARGKYLVRHNDKNMFLLKPDLVIEQAGKPICVLDTKWKRISGNDSANNYGLSQSDFYQIFAYGQKYLGGKGDLVLIYPATETFSKPVIGNFKFDKELRLWIVPFVIHARKDSHLKLNKEICEQIRDLHPSGVRKLINRTD